MPLYHFNCEACQQQPVRRIAATAEEAIAKMAAPCPQCGGKMVRTPKPPTSNIVERLDNGLMPKALERPSEAERLYKERSDNDPRNQ